MGGAGPVLWVGQGTNWYRERQVASLRASQWRGELVCLVTGKDLPCLYIKRVRSRHKQVCSNSSPTVEGVHGDF